MQCCFNDLLPLMVCVKTVYLGHAGPAIESVTVSFEEAKIYWHSTFINEGIINIIPC